MNAQERRASDEALFALIESRRSVTAQEVVAEARPVDSPMHCRFEWDDTVAGERWREEQARGWLRTITMKVRPAESEPLRVRALVAVSAPISDDKVETRYMPTLEARQDPACWDSVLQTARVEARSFRRRLATLEALRPGAAGDVIEVIDSWVGD